VAPRALADCNPFDPALLADPVAYWHQLQDEAPVYKDPHTGITLISTYAEVVEVLGKPEVFSNRFAEAMGGGGMPEEVLAVAEKGYPVVDTMLTADPPEQRRFRSLVNKAFTLRRVRRLEPRIEALSHELMDGFAKDGAVELAAQYAQRLPLIVIAEQLGVPREDLANFRRWSDGFVAQLSQMADLDGQIAAQKLIVEFQHYFAEKLEERRAEPRDDILSEIVNARVDGERPLDVSESLSILQQILVAGNETTAHSISEGMYLLVQSPEQLEKAVANPDLIPNLVEEVLRLSSPTSNMWRVVKEDTQLGGVEVPQGAFVMIKYGAANRDGKVFADPDRFDIERANADEHIAFGQGTHFCLGAMLARLEMNVAFRTLLGRLSGWRLAEDAPAPKVVPNVLLRGLDALHLRFDPEVR